MSEQTELIVPQLYFPTVIYTVEKPEFLEDVKKVCLDALAVKKKDKKVNDLYPVYMTDNLVTNEKARPLASFIANTGWDILKNQGYSTEGLTALLSEFWCQEHSKHSLMEQHTHGNNSQLVGFYFIDTPEGCSKVVFHDPRPGKVQINLQEHDASKATTASDMVNFTPKPGLLIFTNSWLPHSFTRHASKSPIRFIHFSINVQYMQNTACHLPPEAEVI
jgi:uncharacterized protein (TIGR02466 family)